MTGYVPLRERLERACYAKNDGAMSKEDLDLLLTVLEEAGLAVRVREPDGDDGWYAPEAAQHVRTGGREFKRRVSAAIDRVCARGVT